MPRKKEQHQILRLPLIEQAVQGFLHRLLRRVLQTKDLLIQELPLLNQHPPDRFDILYRSRQRLKPFSLLVLANPNQQRILSHR
jgi:hypothetical protein